MFLLDVPPNGVIERIIWWFDSPDVPNSHLTYLGKVLAMSIIVPVVLIALALVIGVTHVIIESGAWKIVLPFVITILAAAYFF